MDEQTEAQAGKKVSEWKLRTGQLLLILLLLGVGYDALEVQECKEGIFLTRLVGWLCNALGVDIFGYLFLGLGITAVLYVMQDLLKEDAT